MLPSPYRKTTLANGLRIVTEEISHVRSVALGVWVTVGSRDENDKNNGMSHFIEHMLFKGTSNRNTQQIAESLEAVGGSLDAFTTKELTCYSAHFLDEHLPLAVDVLTDIISNSIFDSQEIEKEKDVILSEIKHYKDTPDDMVFEYFYQHIFDSHPFGFHIYGKEENIRKFTRKEMIDFLSEEYASNRIVIAAAGNLRHDELVALIANSFKNLPENKQRKIIHIPVTKKMTTEIGFSCSQAHVCFGTRAYSYREDKRFPLMLLHTYLGGGMSSFLFQKIREELGMVYTIYSFFDFSLDNGVFGIYFSSHEKNIATILNLIQQELKKLQRNSLNESTLEKMRNQLKGNLILGLESTMSRMNRIAKNEIYLNRFSLIDDVIQKIDNVTVEEISVVATELFKDEQYITTILKPLNTETN